MRFYNLVGHLEKLKGEHLHDAVEAVLKLNGEHKPNETWGEAANRLETVDPDFAHWLRTAGALWVNYRNQALSSACELD